MSSRLVDSLATTDALADVFSDRSLLQLMLDVEAALARVEARLGVIPARAAEAIATAASGGAFDEAAIARDARQSGTVSIPLVKALTERVRVLDEDSARFVHWGATSQDVADTAIVLAIARAEKALSGDHARLDRAFRALSDRHAGSIMLGRTLLQPAPPITFGLKVAGWVAALDRSWQRLVDAFAAARIVQFGGASGTLAALGAEGPAVACGLADELGLVDPGAPWHAHRDRLAVVVTSAGIYTATLGKIARDVSLLMQDEVGEAAEPGGGSSTMPHKRNPAGCAIALAAAVRVPGLVAAFLSGMVQEHERAVGGWHAEWPTIAAVIQTTGSALASMADVAEGLHVSPDRMRANVAATKGTIFAERVMMTIAGEIGRDAAHALVARAVRESVERGVAFGDIVRATPEISRRLTPADLRDIDAPDAYLGVAEILRTRLLDTAKSSAKE